MGNHHDGVAQRDAKQRYESDQRTERQLAASQEHGEDAANKRKRQISPPSGWRCRFLRCSDRRAGRCGRPQRIRHRRRDARRASSSLSHGDCRPTPSCYAPVSARRRGRWSAARILATSLSALATIGLAPRMNALAAKVVVTPARERSKIDIPMARSSFRMFPLNVDCSMSISRYSVEATVIRNHDGVTKLANVECHAELPNAINLHQTKLS